MTSTSDQIVEVMARFFRRLSVWPRPDSDWDEPDKVHEDNKEAWRQMARDTLSALKQAGWRVVPVEPDMRMIMAGDHAAFNAQRADRADAEKWGEAPNISSIPREVYRAMLQAHEQEEQGEQP